MFKSGYECLDKSWRASVLDGVELDECLLVLTGCWREVVDGPI